MYTKAEFAQFGARQALEGLKGTFKYPKTGAVAEVNDIIEKVLFSVKRYEGAPEIVVNRALYDSEKEGVLSQARISVRPRVSDQIGNFDLKAVFLINAGEDFFDKLLEELISYFENYEYHKKLQANLDALNAEVEGVIEALGKDFTIVFTAGDLLEDATDKHAVIGLDYEVIEDLSSLALFDDTFELRVEGYREKIADTFKQLTRPYDIVKTKTTFTRDLGIYSRKRVNKLIRGFVNRAEVNTRIGKGYIETEDLFAVVERVAVTPEEAKEFKSVGAIVADNKEANKKEKEEGKTKVVTFLSISPFNKEDGVPVDVPLKELLKA